MIVRIREEAEAELEAAFDYYQARRPGLGHALLDDYVHATRAIAQHPVRSPVDTYAERARRCRLTNFPYSVIYQVLSDHCIVIALAHHSRRPGYRKDRLVR